MLMLQSFGLDQRPTRIVAPALLAARNPMLERAVARVNHRKREAALRELRIVLPPRGPRFLGPTICHDFHSTTLDGGGELG